MHYACCVGLLLVMFVMLVVVGPLLLVLVVGPLLLRWPPPGASLSPPPVSRRLLEELLPPTAAAVVNSSAAEEEAPADETLPTSPLQPSARRSRRNLWQRRCGGSGVRRSPLITPVWATVGPCNLPRAHTRTSMGPRNLQ